MCTKSVDDLLGLRSGYSCLYSMQILNILVKDPIVKPNKIAIALVLNAALFNLAHASSTASVYGYGLDLNAPVGSSATYISGTTGSTEAVVDLPSFAAPLGVPGFSMPYPANYGGYASANDSTGTLKAYAKATGFAGNSPTPSRYVTSSAFDEGSYVFMGNADHTVELHYDGTFSDPALAQFPAFASLSLTACALVSESMSGCKTQAINLNSDTNGQNIEGKLSIVISGHTGDSFKLYSSISVTAWANSMSAPSTNFAEAAFNHTAQLDFVLPVGASVQGENGFLSAVPVSFAAAVPEPDSYAMMLAGLGLIGAAVGRRNTK